MPILASALSPFYGPFGGDHAKTCTVWKPWLNAVSRQEHPTKGYRAQGVLAIHQPYALFQRGKPRVMITPKWTSNIGHGLWWGLPSPLRPWHWESPMFNIFQQLVEYIHWILLNTCYTAIRRHIIRNFHCFMVSSLPSSQRTFSGSDVASPSPKTDWNCRCLWRSNPPDCQNFNSGLSPSSPFRLPQNPNCLDKTMLRFIDHLHCTQYDPHSRSKSPCCWLNPIFCRWNPHVSRTFQDIPGPPPVTSIIPPAAFTLKPLTGKSLHVARQWRGNGNERDRIWSIINCGFEGFLSHWGTPKSSSLVGFSIINHPCWSILGIPHFRKPQNLGIDKPLNFDA